MYDEAKGWREHKLQAEIMGYAELDYKHEISRYIDSLVPKQLSSRARSRS